MLAKIFVGVVAAGLLGAGGYLYYTKDSSNCSSCTKNPNNATPPVTPCSLSSHSCCTDGANTSEEATDDLPMPREVVTQ